MAAKNDVVDIPLDLIGEYPEKWTRSTLGQACRLVVDGTHDSPKRSENGYPLVTGKCITGGRIDLSNAYLISEADHQSVIARSKPEFGDILFANIGNSIGELARVDIKVEFSIKNVALFKPSGRLDGKFLKYYLGSQSVQSFIKGNTFGSAQPFIGLGTLRAFPIPLPPLAEQKAIAHVLGTLDDKIELNRKMNVTLEAMARALFKSWFVDFDPVRAKLDGRQPAGMDAATAALFPSEFQESVVGNIPNGWKVGVLDDLTNFVIGGDWGATEITADETVSCYCIRGADIPSLQDGGLGKMPVRFLKPSSVEKRQLFDGDLAIEISGGSPTQCTGRPVLVTDGLLRSLGKPLVASNFCRIIKLKTPVFSKFIYCWLRNLYENGSLFQFETGTTGIKNFAFVLFSEKYPLIMPYPKVAEAFDQAASPLFALIQTNAKQSRTLAALRDTLLPKLLSGELSVPEAMKEVASV